jgi:serine/threonine-protein kinase HipA
MKCSADFFGLKELPAIDIDKETLEELALKSSSLGLTVPGVQKKLSLHLSDEGSSRLTLVGHPAGYILKPQTEDFEQLPQSEDLVMDIAEMMGVRVVPHGLIEVDNKWAYISKRIDRLNNEFYAMEDFCQLSGRLTLDKYKSSYERCAGIIKRYSVMPGFDMSEFYLRLLVCFVTGNSDMHLKNFSLIERDPGSREYVLSSAYDLLPVNVIMPEDTEETALTLNGKKSNLKRKDFLTFADTAGLNNKAATHMIDSVVRRKEEAIRMCRESYLNSELKKGMIALIEERSDRLQRLIG